ncbi:MAG: undecaprenyl/decaprenyl-phosphate alpha-N-acetylglucosaminyl 1-phosphate transferase, partial [Gemmatimonadetes bacterium]|nr:undecaprenyl/decaprenyl-phosphate alpha-N-acetylglucosaminyl 1-phosphate transferase [Gemmatimonadota bacterium]
MSFPLITAIVAALALTLTALLTPLVRGAALGMGLVRQAQADRWHRRPTPAIGGVAIFLGFGIALGVGWILDPEAASALAYLPPQAILPWTPWEGLLAAGTLVFLVGLVDDLFRLNPVQKLAGQIAAAVLLVLSGVGVWLTGLYLLDAALSVLWFVAITNALNLLDNMDGLATGVAAIAGGYLSLLFLLEGEAGLLLLSLAFTAALVGFLVHNYPPARIFMGDSGSLFLGLFLAALSLSPAPGLSRSLFAVVAVPALVLAIPILDTTLVTLGRMLEGRPISEGGKDHTSHRLVALGVSEERALWVLWSLALLGGAIALLLRTVERGTAYVLGGVLLTGLILLGAYLLSVRLRALRRQEGPRLPLYEMFVSWNERVPVLPFVMDALLVA